MSATKTGVRTDSMGFGRAAEIASVEVLAEAPAKMPTTASGAPRFASRESGMEAARVMGMPAGTTNE